MPLQSVYENCLLSSSFQKKKKKSPRASGAVLLQPACYVYLQQHISLVLWSLFRHRICLCLTGPALLKWWRGAQSVWEGDLLFVWCVYGYCSYLLSAGSSWIEKSEETLIKSDRFSPCSNMCNWLTLSICRICVVECYIQFNNSCNSTNVSSLTGNLTPIPKKYGWGMQG